ncbi:LLM class F420-dependent oxidoreductase [Amycolatopsis acidiphila]|uniref:LLM class F420-dependent oxidoreductase n=1 Tax=Amycolatopsis acidiphila TaxID=715473 RepID=A0A558AA48_9PSEU|nr:LLM class F420-dependent oxidoreductase [Amycolatopsis acidiphila]TVT21126.1 LLM class F420-dependent oxidoreductase [Amycolatopsis acidiphila]UIJ57211.1 LLM class F420-dependent oxidoreductase [Amycolatopsis acidiphila]GHG52655.1 LLM class F420-dependent oxidoreductase [Amycolatopsis acidiphila]
MKFDLQHATADPAWTPAILSPSAVTRFARAAEDSGYSSIGFTDHPAPSAKWVRNGGEGSADPFSALGFCAAVTSRIRLLTWVLVLPYRNPFLTAHQTASLDALSGGRLVLGVGTGYLRGEFRALGMDFETRRERFDEALEVLRAAWSGAEITREGDGFSARATLPRPGPVQRPGPPLWVHGNSRWGRLRAARHAEGWVAILATGRLARTMRTAPIDGLDELSRHIAQLRTLTVEQGRPAGAVEVVVSGHWPLLDIRRGWDTARLEDDVGALAERGVDRVVVVVCGDDPGAAEDTVGKLGEELIAPAH